MLIDCILNAIFAMIVEQASTFHGVQVHCAQFEIMLLLPHDQVKISSLFRIILACVLACIRQLLHHLRKCVNPTIRIGMMAVTVSCFEVQLISCALQSYLAKLLVWHKNEL